MPLATRVYVPPHHCAASAYAVPLVDAIRPSAAVISVGAQNRYGHPTAETLAALRRVPTYRTDRDGTVELDHSGGAQLIVRTHPNGLRPPRRGLLPTAPPSRCASRRARPRPSGRARRALRSPRRAAR